MADIDVLMPLIKQFMPFAKEQMGFDRPPKLFLKGDSSNAADPLGKTGFYDPQAESITLYITARHPKDILRSLSHELMHHTQNCRGDFTDAGEMGEGYAQSNPHMRNMEIEAYKASICFRDWEDSLRETIYYEHLQKGDKTMSIKDWKNGELKGLLSEAWGFKMDLNKLNEDSAAKHRTAGDTIEEEVEELDESPRARQQQSFQAGAAAYEKCKPGIEAGTHEWKGYDGPCVEKGVSEAKLKEVSVEDPDVPKEETKGEASTEWEKEGLEEDSGEDEAWHQWKNEHADDDHIREIEYHLRALKHDRDYERDESEYDDDRYEDEGMEERRRRGRATDAATQGRVVPGEVQNESREVKLRAMVRNAIKEAMK